MLSRMSKEETKDVVTSFLVRSGKVLLFKRSKTVNTYPERWAGISGYRENNPPEAQARREIKEETGLEPGEIKLAGSNCPLEVAAENYDQTYRIFPFKFNVTREIKLELNWENTDYKWIQPEQMDQLDTVPRLQTAWRRVADE